MNTSWAWLFQGGTPAIQVCSVMKLAALWKIDILTYPPHYGWSSKNNVFLIYHDPIPTSFYAHLSNPSPSVSNAELPPFNFYFSLKPHDIISVIFFPPKPHRKWQNFLHRLISTPHGEYAEPPHCKNQRSVPLTLMSDVCVLARWHVW